MTIRQHKESGLWVREDGAVLMPPGGHFYKFRWTFGCQNKYGYMVVIFHGKQYRVHRLVAETFIPNPLGLSTVDHINRNRSNNAVSNLRWADRKMQNNNRQICEDSLAKYGVRCCDDPNAYAQAYYANNHEFAERQRAYKRAYNREYYAKQKALGKRQRTCLDDKIFGDLQAKDAEIAALSNRVASLIRAKTSAEKIMHYLIDHKMISGWYFNGEFHIEINHEKVV